MDLPLAIDGRMLERDETGVGAYADALFTTLTAAGRSPLVLAESPGTPPGRLGRLVRAARPGPRRLAPPLLARPGLWREAQVHFDLYGRALALRAPGPPGIIHWTYPVPLRLAGWRNLYTVHDLIPLARPDLTTIDPGRHRRLLKAILPHAHRLVTVSATARAEAVRLLGWPEDRVVDAGQAVDPRPGGQTLLPAGGFFLFCGRIDPRKNLAALAEAHARSGSARPLVVTGPVGDAVLAAELDARPGVLRLPYQARATLFAWMRDARALLFPSLAEGFGLPIAEAMMLGTPVMTSAGGATGEAAGEAGLLVDPLDLDAMAGAIRRLDRDDPLVADLARRGRARAVRWTPAAHAERLLALYAEAAA